MNFKLEGKGETIVFIHGLSDNLLYWEFLATNLKKDYQILRIDLRGHGKSQSNTDEITMKQYVNDLLDLINELNIDKINLIGFSLGGAVALEFTINYPNRVSSLVLMSTFAKPDENLSTIFNNFKKTLSNSFEEFYDYILPMILCPDIIQNNKQELESLKHISSKTANCQALIKSTDVCSSFNVENQLCEINIPTLILAGKYDDITPTNIQKSIHAKIKNSKLLILDDMKHDLLVGENNEKILKILKKFYI